MTLFAKLTALCGKEDLSGLLRDAQSAREIQQERPFPTEQHFQAGLPRRQAEKTT